MTTGVADSLLLALETSTLAGSVALAERGKILSASQLSAARRKTGELMPAIQRLYAEAGRSPGETGVVAYSAGPGSFTGLRSGATIARMMRLSAGAKVVAVSSLAATAASLVALTSAGPEWRGSFDAPPPDDARIGVLLDARGGLLFGARYQVVPNEGNDAEIPISPRLALRIIDEPAARSAAEWRERFSPPVVVTGDGIERCLGLFDGPGTWIAPPAARTPTAECVASIGRALAAADRFCAPHEILPHYIRPPECEEVFEQRKDAARQKHAARLSADADQNLAVEPGGNPFGSPDGNPRGNAENRHAGPSGS